MHSFIAAGDDSEKGDWSVFGGFSGRLEVWNSMLPEWEKQVLKTPPVLEYLHMSDIYRKEWRDGNGMDEDQMRQKLDAAADITSKTPGLRPVTCAMPISAFKAHVAGRRFRIYEERKQDKKVHFGRDYMFLIHFIGHHIHLLLQVEKRVDQVDFWVEQKGGFTCDLSEYRTKARAFLRGGSVPGSEKYLGEVLPATKLAIQAQAADFLVWHEASARNGALGLSERRRFDKCIDNKDRNGCVLDEASMKAIDQALRGT